MRNRLTLIISISLLLVCCKSQILSQSKIAPQSESSDLNKAVSIAQSKFVEIGKSTKEYRIIEAQLDRAGAIWTIIFKPVGMIPDGSNPREVMALGGEVIVIVNLKTGGTEVYYGE